MGGQSTKEHIAAAGQVAQQGAKSAYAAGKTVDWKNAPQNVMLGVQTASQSAVDLSAAAAQVSQQSQAAAAKTQENLAAAVPGGPGPASAPAGSSGGSALEATNKTASLYRRPVTGSGELNAYDQMVDATAVQGGFVGGGAAAGGFFGGGPSREEEEAAADLQSYRYSVASATKKRLVRGLAQAMKDAGLSVDPEASGEVIVKQLQDAIPRPDKGTTFSSNAGSQVKVCQTVAKALNREFAKSGEEIFDTKLGPKAICLQLADLVDSLALGLNSEFLEVHASLTRALRRLTDLDEFMKVAHRNIVENSKKGDYADSSVPDAIDSLNELYARAEQMRAHQVRVIQNTLAVVIGPAREELASAMMEQSDVHDVVAELGAAPGGKKMADAIAMVISGVGTIAAISDKVDRALQETGLSVGEYVDSDLSKSDLRERLFALQREKPDLDFGEFSRATEVLMKNFSRREELRPELEDARAAHGGDDVPKKLTSYEKRVRKVDRERAALYKQYTARMTRHYNEFLEAVNAIGPQLGKEIPLSDKLAELRDAVAALDTNEQLGIGLEFALIGYYREAEARQAKETYITNMKMVLRAVDDIASLDMYRASGSYFARLRAPIAAILETIEYYSGLVSKRFGAGEAEDSEVKGGDDPYEFLRSIQDEAGEAARSAYDLQTAVNAFKYFFYVAKVYENLKQTSLELESYGEKYTSVLGDAVAGRLRTLKTEHNARVSQLDIDLKNAPGSVPEADKEKIRANAKNELTKAYECKTKFYRALQGIDLYLKAFTSGIVAHPEDVQDIKRILDGVQVIGRWFVDDTGDKLARAFEEMPGFDGKHKGAFPSGSAGHYYADPDVKKGDVGVPLVFTDPKEAAGKKVRAQIKKVIDDFQALKNLVNAFARIGERFGGKSLEKAAFMSPTEIYYALLEYLNCSALSLGLSTHGNPLSDSGVSLEGDGAKISITAGRGDDKDLAAKYGLFFGSAANRDKFRGDYQTEDRFFTYIIKAMAAKVLTVLGVYDLFERPSPLYDLTPTRMIIGGAEFDNVEAIPEAAELYFRLPRLAEFYKSIFGYDSALEGSGGAYKISMIPDFEGIFGNLVSQVFTRVVAPDSGDYSDSEIRMLVSEINKIYAHFREKDGTNATNAALAGFVAEINRRYGIVKSADWEAYKKLYNYRRRGQSGLYKSERGSQTNYAILPGETDEFAHEGRAPSDRFLLPGELPETKRPDAVSDFDLDSYSNSSVQDDLAFTHWNLLKKFRKTVDEKFAGFDLASISYGSLIKQASTEMSRAGSSDKKMSIATRLILGSATLSGADTSKSFMFHESAILGLDILRSIQAALETFQKTIASINVAGAKSLLGGQHDDGSGTTATIDGSNLVGAFKAKYGVNPVAVSVVGLDSGSPADAVIRRVFDFPQVMETLIEAIFGLTSDFEGLVQVRFPQSQVSQLHLDFSKLRRVIEELYADVRGFFDTFRASIPKDVMGNYEESLRQVEIGLLEKIVQGPPETIEEARAGAGKAETLDSISRVVNETFVALIRAKDFDDNVQGYGNLLAKLVFYDAQDAGGNSGVSGGVLPFTGAEPFDRLLSGAGDALQKMGLFPKNSAGGSAAGRLDLYSLTLGTGYLDNNQSLLFMFNKILAKYLRTFFDVATNKIYRGLIDTLANGAFSRAVMQPGNAIPDLIFTGDAPAAFGIRGDPKNGAVLTNSLAWVLRSMVTAFDQRSQQSLHLVATMSELPLYMKESFRANLPVYVKLFGILQMRGEFFKQLINLTEINCARTVTALARNSAGATRSADEYIEYTGALAPVTTTFGSDTTAFAAGSVSSLHPLVASANVANSAQFKQRLTEIIDSVNSGCYTASNAIAEVSRELADVSPLYFETQENSIAQYKARYGKLPLMPLSLALRPLRDASGRGVLTSMVPEYSSGDPHFKFMYGTRKVLGHSSAELSLDDMPGVQQILRTYNGTSEGRDKIEPDRYERFMRNATSLLRYLVDLRHYRAIMSNSPVNKPDLGSVSGLRGFAFTVGSLAELVSIAESSFQDEQIQKIAQGVPLGRADRTLRTATGSARSKEWYVNIVDMNIIPINVHALMRGMPLAPLYNYAHTFDQLACSIFGVPLKAIDDETDLSVPSATTKHTKAFLKLLLEPYAPVGEKVYGNSWSSSADTGQGLITDLFRGNGDLPLGRPKFLSDQIFGKSLFGNLAAFGRSADFGPARSADVVRGAVASTPGASTANVNQLIYLKESEKPDERVQVVPVDSGVRRKLAAVGRMRFDTRLVRNLVFITNVLRTLRLKLNTELTQYRNVLVDSHSLVNPSITEYGYVEAANRGRNPAHLETPATRQYLSDRDDIK